MTAPVGLFMGLDGGFLSLLCALHHPGMGGIQNMPTHNQQPTNKQAEMNRGAESRVLSLSLLR